MTEEVAQVGATRRGFETGAARAESQPAPTEIWEEHLRAETASGLGRNPEQRPKSRTPLAIPPAVTRAPTTTTKLLSVDHGTKPERPSAVWTESRTYD